MRRRPVPSALRFLVYGLVGWAADSLFVWAHTGRRPPSSLLNVPVYGLAQPLFEPLHDRLRPQPVLARAALYGTGALAVEYASGRLLRRLLGRAPWDYGVAGLGVHGLVRLDYFPLWAGYALALERLHDSLVPASLGRRPGAAHPQSTSSRATSRRTSRTPPELGHP